MTHGMLTYLIVSVIFMIGAGLALNYLRLILKELKKDKRNE